MTHGCVPDENGSCSICADVAHPARVISVNIAERTGDVMLPDGVATIALDLVDAVTPGDFVLVHLGFAIGRLEPEAE